MIDLWIRNPKTYLRSALQEGFRKFTWHFPVLIQRHLEILSSMRLQAVGYTGVKVMLIDDSGAAEYTLFGEYSKPDAVYPVWNASEDTLETLEWLSANPVGSDLKMCTDERVDIHMRPVFGQKHKIVIHHLPSAANDREALKGTLDLILEYQSRFPECDFQVSNLTHFSQAFGMGFRSVDFQPPNILPTGSKSWRLVLPSGKNLASNPDAVRDRRYADWFALVGWHQSLLVDTDDVTAFNLASINWAWRNFNLVQPFVWQTSLKRDLQPGLFTVSDKDFVLPTARRNLMRNLGMLASESDKFLCDACILHNACTVYREGSVCGLRGSEGMGLAGEFSTRNVDRIIGALGKIVEKQAERLERAAAAEEMSGETDPEVTKMYKTVFDQGTKLAKLIDPKLNGSAVNVNVGVNGNAAVQVQASDPRQMVAAVVAELESAGIPRDQITSNMIKGMLASMSGDKTMQQAAQSVAAIEGKVV